MEFNKYQTKIEDLTFEDRNAGRTITWENAPDEVKKDFLEHLNGVPLIRRLISADRPYVKDLPRDEQGRAIIDITNPPILENVDYFRPTALHYKQTGKLTDLRPNRNPNSAYYQWQYTETRRCWNGYLREEDGAYIPGYMYWYLNYCPIMLSRTINGIDYQVPDMPDFWEGVWWRMLGWWDARRSGLNFAEISSRGKSKSYSLAAGLSRIYTIGDFEPPPGQKVKNARAVVMAGTKEFLTKDGTLNKFEDMVSFLSDYTQYPSKQLQANLKDMTWQRGYIDLDSVTKKGTLNTVLGVAVKEDVEKGRGKRAALIGLEEFGAFPNVDAVYNIALPSVTDGEKVFGLIVAIGTGGAEGCLTENNYVFNAYGELKKIKNITCEDGIIGYDIKNQKPVVESIEHINTPTKKMCVHIDTNDFNHIECSIDHPIYASNHYDCNEIRVWEWINAGDLKPGDLVAVCQEIPFFGNEHLGMPYLIGLLIGDGCYLTSPRIISCDFEIHEYLTSNFKVKEYKTPEKTKDGRYLREFGIKGIRDYLRALGIYGQSKNKKRLPEAIFRCVKEDVCELLAGLFDTDGCIFIGEEKGKRKPATIVYYASSCLQLVQQIQTLLLKIGVQSNIYKKKPSTKEKRVKDKNSYYSLEINSREGVINFHNNVKLRIKYKQALLDKAAEVCKTKKKWRRNNFYYTTVVNVENIGEQTVYNLSAAGHHTYLGNGIITHNSDFSGAMNMIYHPRGYRIKSYENVWDIEGRAGKDSIFCFPAYINRSGCMDENGISDVTLALFRICCERYLMKYNNPDPMQLTRTKAEYPITLQDAIMQRDGAYFPTAQLMERLQEIDSDPNFYDGVYVGDFKQTTTGKVEFVNADLTPIRKYRQKTNKIGGAVEIYEMPKTDSMGHIPEGRYIASLDPIDDDESQTLSFVSLFIFDLWTDRVVCEWTGRLGSADECYERVRLAVMFYNAKLLYENNKKGVFTYFKAMNSVKYMMETPTMLKDETTQKENLNNTKYGVNATENFNKQARFFIKDWLLKPFNTIQKIDGEDTEVTLHNYNTLKQRALIEELIAWNKDGNFDRVSSFGILMFARQEKIVTTAGKFGRGRDAENYKGNDEFFTKQWERFARKNGIEIQ